MCLCHRYRHLCDICCGSYQGTHSILEEESHIKDVLSRIIVEMIKREWPQHWPDMLKEMEALSSEGVSNLCCATSLYLNTVM